MFIVCSSCGLLSWWCYADAGSVNAVDEFDADADGDADANVVDKFDVVTDADGDADAVAYLNMLHQVPGVREAKRAVAALKVWRRCLVGTDLHLMIIKMMMMVMEMSGRVG